MNNDFLDALSIDELWEKYAAVHNRLKDLGQIRSRNITGDFGEQLAISMYNKTKGLPKLQMAPPSTKNIDAISTAGDRYSIKTITHPNKTTGVFHGYGTPDKPISKQMFEYLIVVVIKDYKPKLILELDWNNFYHLKRWHSTMQAHNISLSKAVVEKSKIIYQEI